MSRVKPSRHAPEEIDAYLEALPEDVRTALARVRCIIRESVPACTERVSYGIPIFRLGKDLVGMSAQQNHCSLHSMSPALIKSMTGELSGFSISGATIHFTPDNPLPESLLVQIVRARVKAVEKE